MLTSSAALRPDGPAAEALLVSMDLRKGSTDDNPRYLRVLVNGLVVGELGPEFGGWGEDGTILELDIEGVDTAGDVDLEIQVPPWHTGYRDIVVDNIIWTGYSH